MKNHGWTLGLFLLPAVILFIGCHQPGKQENHAPTWSSKDPLTIPYRIRQQKFEKANLVKNGSFETGKVLSIDTLHKSYSVDGWQLTSDNVQWIDPGNDSASYINEVFSGKHAIKIYKKQSDEIADKGEGILSAYIRVIPGNYSFSFYTRLLDIRPYSARLGTRMYDAVEVRLFFYDKNKNLLDSRILLPFKGQKIDNSFKSLSFANFEYIKEFGWGRIVGKSHNFPFKEGDIPDAARHVRIFIGLKGTGSMWIDDVDLHFTASNFSPLECMINCIDSAYSRQDLIIPTPKQLTKLESVLLFKPGEGKETLPRIIVPAVQDVVTRQTAELILEKIRQVLKTAGADEETISSVKLQSSASVDELRSSRLVISLGKTVLYEKYSGILPAKSIQNHRQGYFIYSSNDLPNIVFLAGNNNLGDYYAVTTILQLFDNQYPVLHKARIIDYPDFQQRFFHIHAWQEQSEKSSADSALRRLMLYKPNGAYIGVNLKAPLQYYLNTLNSFSEPFIKTGLFDFMQFVGPGFIDEISYVQKANDNEGNTILHVNDVKTKIHQLVSAGHYAHMLGVTFSPSFLLPCDTTMEYNASQLLALSDNFQKEKKLIIDIQNQIRLKFREQKIEYCIPWYNNELVDFSLGYADVLLASLKEDLDPGTTFLWSGSSFYTRYTDAADVYRFTNIIGTPPVLLDNSLLSYSKTTGYDGSSPYFPGQLRLYNIFEPYPGEDLCYYRDILNGDRVFINQVVNSEMDEIKMLTALDFYWNMNAYDPCHSLWKILVSRYGHPVAKELILFADAGAKMMEINLRIQRKDQANKNYRIGISVLPELRQHLENIIAGLGINHPLVIELTALNENYRSTFEKFNKLPIH